MNSTRLSPEREGNSGGYIPRYISTILDETVEKIVYLDSIFLKIVAVPVLHSPPSP